MEGARLPYRSCRQPYLLDDSRLKCVVTCDKVSRMSVVCCKNRTAEELKTFLRSDKALQVYSNMQEIQALANIFNIPIDVFKTMN